MKDLLYKHESSLFIIMALISIGFWGLLILGTLGIALVYLFFVFLFYLFAHSALISYIKGTGVKLSEEQFPELYQQLQACCSKLEIDTLPETYILHADGIFNAFATRFLRRNFIVLYSDIVDALKDNQSALNFYMGHELGHIHRKHLLWGPVLLPASILPLIGAAYSRAREYTCDNYGYACCEDPKNAVAGLVVLATGPHRWKTVKIKNYIGQVSETGGFWMSFNELVSDYPWLVKRTSRMAAKAMGKPVQFPSRHPLAWFFALFTPRTGLATSGGSVIAIIAIIGILAAIAIPQFQAYRTRAALSAIDMSSMQEEYAYDSDSDANEVDSQEIYMRMELESVYNLEQMYFEAKGVYTSSLIDLNYEQEVSGIDVEIISADGDCFKVLASDVSSGKTLQIDCHEYQ